MLEDTKLPSPQWAWDRYQPSAEVEEWRRRDPLPRMRHYLERRGLWTEAEQQSTWTDAGDQIAAAIVESESTPMPSFQRYVEAAGG